MNRFNAASFHRGSFASSSSTVMLFFVCINARTLKKLYYPSPNRRSITATTLYKVNGEHRPFLPAWEMPYRTQPGPDRSLATTPTPSTSFSSIRQHRLIINTEVNTKESTWHFHAYDCALLDYFLARLLVTEYFRSFETSKPIGSGFQELFFLPFEL